MSSLPKKYTIYIYIYIYILIPILIVSAIVLIYKYYLRNSLSFKVDTSQSLEKSQVAAILLLTPPVGQFYIDDTIKVSLLVNALGQPINVVDGTITFPSDKLQVTDISKTGSIVSLWVQEPIASSSLNSVSFSGGLPSPGFTGIAGKIMTISFKVIGAGDALIGLDNAHVLANDGVGTDILADTTPARLTLLVPKIAKIVGDTNGDNKVDLIDVSILLANYGAPKNKTVDLNGDSKVDVKDLSILLSGWSR
jgi:hypothetical protein